MTRYAVDQQGHALIAVWGTGAGDIATTIATVPASASIDDVLRLARALTDLSETLWHRYAEPNRVDDPEPNSEDWHRQGERRAFADVTEAIRSPNLPEGGMLVQSYVAVQEAAHRVGRAVHAIGDDDLEARVVAEAQAELRAIHSAEIGDFSGRARQAVLISRAVASLGQVAAADALLSADPLGSDRLFTTVDPTAAAVAAAHWLRAAATIVAHRAGLDRLEVMSHADDLEIMPVRTTAAVLERLSSGESTRDVVVDLVDKAMRVAKGELPDPEAPVADVQAARRRRRRAHRARAGEQDEPPRASLLDPRRPSRDLLEDLLEGLRGCWLLYQEYADDPDDDPEACDDSDDADTGARQEWLLAAFRDEVRSEAAATRDRLL